MSETEGYSRTDAQCPRCGYDLRGTVSAWTAQCPLAGTCTECGLALDWPAVIMPEKFEPTWCVEFVRGWKGVPRGCVHTLLRSCRPVKFWKAHDMSHRLRKRRLLAYAVFLLLMVLVAFVLEQSATTTRVYFIVKQQNANSQSVLQSLAATAKVELARLEAGEGEESPERRAELIQRYRRLLANTPAAGFNVGMPISLGGAILDAITRPFSMTPPATNAAGAFGQYPAPGEFINTIVSEINSTTGRRVGDVIPLLPATIYIGGYVGWSAWLFLPVGFAFLPMTRRKAKVRWAHVGRVWVYSLAIPAVALASGLLFMAFALGTTVWMDFLTSLAGFIAGPFVLLATLLWWRSALRHYLHMPHAWLIVVLLSVLGSLLFWAVIWIIFAMHSPLI